VGNNPAATVFEESSVPFLEKVEEDARGEYSTPAFIRASTIDGSITGDIPTSAKNKLRCKGLCLSLV
jgi:hypothetical protein